MFCTPDDTITEKCAVFGAYRVGSEAARTVFYGLWALQHRGQESSGITSFDGQRLHSHSAPGLVANVYREEDLEQLAGETAIGHNRYSTSGASGGAHLQPVVRHNGKLAFAHNGNLPQTAKLEAFLDSRNVPHAKLNDSEMMAEALHLYTSDGLALDEAVERAWPLFTGAFSAIALQDGVMVAFRDGCGIRPLSIGRLGDGYVVSSETCAFDTVGAQFVRDVRPGEMVILRDGAMTSRQVVPANLKLDIFELVYFARPDSVLEGMCVHEVRRRLGEELAAEHPVAADLVVPVPDSAIPAALGYASASGIPFEMALIKNRYIHRTFIRPSAELRTQDLKMKLNPLPTVLKGKRVVLLDDSIVRGTTLRKIASMVYEAGAREVHVRISSPPVRYPDFYGIDMPNQDDLIAHTMTTARIAKHLGVDSLGYLSYDGMVRATGRPADTFSTACFNGVYPLGIGSRANALRQPATL